MTFGLSFWKKGSLYQHTLMYYHGTWTQWSLSRVTHVTSTELGSKVIKGSTTFGSVFWGKGHCITLMYFHGTWTHWSLGNVTHVTSTDLDSKVIQGSMNFGSMFWYEVKSDITMITKVCERESRWDSWFENRLVFLVQFFFFYGLGLNFVSSEIQQLKKW